MGVTVVQVVHVLVGVDGRFMRVAVRVTVTCRKTWVCVRVMVVVVSMPVLVFHGCVGVRVGMLAEQQHE